MAGIDQFFVHRRGVGKDAQPAERINPFENLQAVGRDRLPCHAMEAVAAGDVVAVESIALAVFFKRDEGFSGLHCLGNDVLDAVEGRGACNLTSGHQVASDFGLAVDHHGFSAGKGVQIDVHLATVERQFKAVVDQSFGIHALSRTGLAQQLYHALFKHPGTDAPEDVVRGLAFQNEGVDSSVVQQLAEEQSGWACTNDGDLGF